MKSSSSNQFVQKCPSVETFMCDTTYHSVKFKGKKWNNLEWHHLLPSQLFPNKVSLSLCWFLIISWIHKVEPCGSEDEQQKRLPWTHVPSVSWKSFPCLGNLELFSKFSGRTLAAFSPWPQYRKPLTAIFHEKLPVLHGSGLHYRNYILHLADALFLAKKH